MKTQRQNTYGTRKSVTPTAVMDELTINYMKAVYEVTGVTLTYSKALNSLVERHADAMRKTIDKLHGKAQS